MSIEQEDRPCYIVRCDTCQETYGGDEYACMHFEGTAEAEDAVKCSDWRVNEDGSVECIGCYDERLACA